jgi:hypothetical protein
MSEHSTPALTAEQWESRDYRQAARELDTWAGTRGKGGPAHDATEYVAKVGLDESGTVIAMNRAHDRVLIPPPVRPVLAAFALVDQPFGFTRADVEALQRAAEGTQDQALGAALRSLGDRLQSLLPPANQ